MSFIYIVGVAGSGKSAIANALSERGFLAYDEDEPGIGSAHNRHSGLPVQIPPVEHRTPEWFDSHEWRLSDSAFQTLVLQSAKQDVVLCGNSLTDEKLQLINAKILYLRIDDATLVERITNRPDNDYGQSKSELAEIRKRHSALDQRFVNDAIVIDATRPLNAVIAEITPHCCSSPRHSI